MDLLLQVVPEDCSRRWTKCMYRVKLLWRIVAITAYTYIVCIGVIYSSEEDCNVKSSLFMLVTGGLGISWNIIGLFWTSRSIIKRTHCFKTADRYINRYNGDNVSVDTIDGIVNDCCTIVLPSCINFCILLSITIWGSVVVLGPYKNWRTGVKEGDIFCNSTLYISSFIVVILGWFVLLPYFIFFIYCFTKWCLD